MIKRLADFFRGQTAGHGLGISLRNVLDTVNMRFIVNPGQISFRPFADTGNLAAIHRLTTDDLDCRVLQLQKCVERRPGHRTYLDHAHVRQLDLTRNTVSTDVDEIAFDAALLSPPQQAAQLVWDAGLIRTNPQSGQADAWADVGALDFRSRLDERIWVIGDAVGMVSSLFGQYPKTGHLAASMGRIAAAQVAAAISGQHYERELPESVCHVQPDAAGASGVRIETRYRERGDGFLMQEAFRLSKCVPWP